MSCHSCGTKFTGILKNCKYCRNSVCDRCFHEYHHCEECESLCQRDGINCDNCDFCGFSGGKHRKITVSAPTATISYNDNYSDSYEEGRCVVPFQQECIPRLLFACCRCLKTDATVLSCLKTKTEHAKKFQHKICDICTSSDICLEQIIIRHRNSKLLKIIDDEYTISETYSLSCMGCSNSHEKLDSRVFEALNLVRFHRLNCDFCCQCLVNIKSNIHLISDLSQLVIDYIS